MQIRKTGDTYKLASTQGMQSMDTPDGDHRPLVRETTLEEYRKDPNFAAEQAKMRRPASRFTSPILTKKKTYAWGMAIDLNSCVGCNNCIMACQSENNIAVVGKEQTELGRHMHWIRVDAYYQGDRDNPKAYFQPVPCMQCEDAPCELVCPVGATNHSSEGLNDMVYNRCVGTRYCSNNCPYKVRRFNFLLFQDWETPQYKMMRNPDVSVRSRGVMEKCTYCVQRINERRIDAETASVREGKDIRIGDELQTACQQSCPADAIVFGNINDPNSKVSKLKAQSRNYSLLGELNTRPAHHVSGGSSQSESGVGIVKEARRRGAGHEHEEVRRAWNRAQYKMTVGTRHAMAQPGSGNRARPYLRHGHGQDQLHRADPAGFERMVPRLRRRLHAHDDDALRHRLPVSERHRHLGRDHPDRLGLRHRQFRLVDRNRPRRHADLRHSSFVAAVVAQFHQPLRRGYDAVCRGLRRTFPAASRRPSLAGLLAVSLSQHHGRVAAVPQPA